MIDPILQDQIAAATAYEELHVPALFRQWAGRVLDAARIRPGHRVLDVACGTGVLAREALDRVGPAGSVAGIDPNPGMLVVAERLAPRIEWRKATAESLPFRDQSVDGVVSQFGLMFFTDRRQALSEMARVLVPGGRVAVAVWDSLDQSPAYSIEVELLERLAGQRAAEAMRAPFVLGSREELIPLFESAEIASVDITTITGRASYPSIRCMVEADLRGWLPVRGVVLTEEEIQRILAEAAGALSGYVTAEGNVVFDSPAHIITGTKA